jgi:23S rRNA pseudouridine2605 synthase
VAAERLQKIIASAGITSRRKAEELITQGRVTVNGAVITELGSKADPERDHIKVDGKLLRGPERHIYLLLNKPKGYVTTLSDPEGRPTVMDLVKHVGERIYPVGRLDYSSEGLLLMTNDGELANFLTRAASHVAKTYLVKISGQASEEEIDKLRHGIRIGSKPGMRGMQTVRTAPAQVRIVREAENPWYEVTLIEGKNRQIRRMFEEIGHHVEKIKRVRYGPLSLDVEPGQFRELKPQEITALRKAKPQPSPAPLQTSAARAAARFIGKAGSKGREQERWKNHAAARPGARDGQSASREEKFRPAPRRQGERAHAPKRSSEPQAIFERQSRPARTFKRSEKRSQAHGPRPRFKR